MLLTVQLAPQLMSQLASLAESQHVQLHISQTAYT